MVHNQHYAARDHAFFWDGTHYQLTPAYDICPMLRLGYSASQAMIVGKSGAQNTLANALSCCDRFNLDVLQADKLNQELVAQIKLHWPAMCERAQISTYEKSDCKNKLYWLNTVFNKCTNPFSYHSNFFTTSN